jgi:putative spermidine/putrescine transport system substrate-binding protein
MPLSRRHFLCGAAASLLVPKLALADESLVVGTWGGDYGNLLRSAVDDTIMHAQGITVTQDIGSPMMRRTKLLAERSARRSSLDVVCLADFDMNAGNQAGALAPLSAGDVPRTAQVLPFLRKSYSIPHIYSAHVIVYNTDLVKTPPKAFADLWDPKYKGKVGLCDFLYVTNTVVAAVVGGGSPTNLAPAKARLSDLRNNDVKVLPSTEALAAALKSGEIWFTVIAAARAYMWNKAGVPVAFVVPEEGGFPTTYEAGVVKNGRNDAAGFKYLNAMLSVEAQTAYAQRMGYLPTVVDARLPAELEKKIGFTEAERNRLWKLDLAYLNAQQANMLKFWNESLKA